MDSNIFLFGAFKKKRAISSVCVRIRSSLGSIFLKDRKQCQTSIFDLTVTKTR